MPLPGGATPANFVDRFREMNSQERLIEQKKKEIEQREFVKKQQDLRAAASGDAAAAKKLAGCVRTLLYLLKLQATVVIGSSIK